MTGTNIGSIIGNTLSNSTPDVSDIGTYVAIVGSIVAFLLFFGRRMVMWFETKLDTDRARWASLEKRDATRRTNLETEVHELRAENTELRERLTAVTVALARLEGEMIAIRRQMGDTLNVQMNKTDQGELT